MNPVNCITREINQLTDQIYRIRVQAEQGNLFEFKGGQYLFLIMPDGNRVPLSIASAPEEKDFIELHIRLMASGGLVEAMLKLFQSSQAFQIEGPYGRCFLEDGENDVVIIAGGTGFSPMKSMLESALARGVSRNLSLYLGAQTPAELYQSPLIESLDSQNDNFSYVPVIGESCDDWTGKVGFPHEIALKNLGDKAQHCEYFISGSEAMVVNVYKALKAAGVPPKNVHSDILDIKRDKGEVL